MDELIVYILKCSDGSYYVGLTNDINIRVFQHNDGKYTTSYTYNRRPVELMWFNKFQSKLEAIKWEKKLKGWTRKKKEALIEGKFDLLPALAECKNESHSKNKV
ncbi:MAG: GIY-YIG nuclease family protein [Bacteroidia bacterium]|nr:GIY-YIG nuclease family protein [Bacteroidia bacterium]